MLISSVEESGKKDGRLSVYVDNKFAFTMAEDDYLRLGFYEKKEISEEEINAVKYDINLRSAKNAGIKFLAFKLRTAKEVVDKLSSCGFEDEIAAMAVEILRAAGYIDDSLYAKKFVREKLKMKPCSKKLLRYELECRGVSKEDISNALDEVEIDERETAEAITLKKFGKCDFKDEKVIRKIYSFLLNRGFGGEIIKNTIEKVLKAQEE